MELDKIWEELELRFGATEFIAEDIGNELKEFPVIQDARDGNAMLKLYDLCKRIWMNMRKCPELQRFNLSTGTVPVREKLPTMLQDEWAKVGMAYKKDKRCHPPFKVFADFLHAEARARADKGFELCKPVSSTVASKVEKVPRASPPKVKTAKMLITQANNADERRT